MKKIASAVMSLGAVIFVAVACGDSTTTTPPKTPPTAPAIDEDAGGKSVTSAASTDPPPPQPSTSSTATSNPPSDSDGGAAPPPSKPPVIIGETKDECTPVGVDFEKRARPKLKDCYAAGKKKTPDLQGTVKIKMTVDVKGKIKTVKVIEKTLPDAVADCMLGAVKSTPFPEVEKCWDSTLTIPITFPTPK